MSPTPMNAREHLASLGIDHARLSPGDLVMMSYALRGCPLVPVTPAAAPPICARAWLLATVNTRGRYNAPERLGHPADLEDGGALVDSVVLMALLQRHFLPRPEPGWDDTTLAGNLGVDPDDLARTQIVLDAVLELPLHAPRPAPNGPHWWRARTRSASLRSDRADRMMLRRYGRVLTNREIAEAVRRTPGLRPPAPDRERAFRSTSASPGRVARN